jgi:predicted RND superfamily exporter protein
MTKLIRTLDAPIRRHSKGIVFLSVIMTVVGGYLTSKLKLDTDLAALLPDSFTSVQALRKMESEVGGGTSSLRVALKSQDFSAATALAHQLAEALVESESVGSVDYQNDVDFYERNALLFLDEDQLDSLQIAIEDAIEAHKQALNPFMVEDLFGDAGDDVAESDDLARWEEEYEGELPARFYANPDSTVIVLKVLPAPGSSGLGADRRMVADVRRIVEESGPTNFAADMEVFYGSNIKNRIDELDAITSDVVGTAAYGLTGVFLCLVFVFRGVLTPLLISFTLASSLAWTFGLTFLLIGQLNLITAFLFVVLFGLGVDYGIHAMARYRESRQAGLDLEGSLHRMVVKTGSALGVTALTTASAFFSLMFLDFRGFSELGLISGIGVIFAFVAMVVLLPALVVVAEDLGVMKTKPIEGKALGHTVRPFPFAKRIVAVTAVLTVVAVALFRGVGFEYDFTNLRIITEERAEYSRETSGVFTRSESPAIILADSPEEVEEIAEIVRSHRNADTETPTVESVRSLLSLVPANQQGKLAKIAEIRDLVAREAEGVLEGEDERRVERLQGYLAVDRSYTWDEFPAKDRQQFTDKDGDPGNFVLIYPGVALRDGRNAMLFRDDIGTIVTSSGKEFYAASSNIIVAEMLTMITREGPIAVALSLSMVFVIILLQFRNLRATLLVLTPLGIGILWLGGLMYVFGWQLNFFNVVVFPSLVGIGVDDGVHIYHRYKEEGPGSLPFVVRRTGLAILITTVTTMIGYSGLIMASHPGLQSIGFMAVVGLGTTLITAAVLLPAILELVPEKSA